MAIGAGIVVFGLTNQIVKDVTGKGLLDHASDWMKKQLAPENNSTVNETDTIGSSKNLPSIAGSKNQSALGKSIPLILGRTLFTPYVLGQPYTTLSGTDGCDQTYHALFLVGYHNLKIENVSVGTEVLASNSNGVENGDLTITTNKYSDVHLELQQGSSEVSLYNQKVFQENFNVELLKLGETYGGVRGVYAYAFSERYAETCELEINLPCLYKYDDEGHIQNEQIDIKVEQSLDGGITWVNSNDVGGGSWQMAGSTNKGGYSYGCEHFINNKTTQMRYAFRVSFTKQQMDNCDSKVVQFRISRESECNYFSDSKHNDRCYFTAIRTWCYDPDKTAEYNMMIPQAPMNEKERNKTCRLGFRIKVTEDLQNRFDTINLIATSKARTWNGTGWSKTLSPTRNPASLALMVMTGDYLDERYRHNLTEGEIYMESNKIDLLDFGYAYDYYAETKNFGGGIEKPRYFCDGAVVNSTKKIDLVNNILRTARSFIVLKGKKYGIFIDKPQSVPLLTLNNNNLLSLTLSKNFDELPDGQSVRYISDINYYQQDTIAVKPYSENPSDMVVRPTDVLQDVELVYITDPYHAKAMSLYNQACQKLRPETLVAKVSTEGGLAEVGSLVTIQSPTISVGIGEGGEIVELIKNHGVITGIKTDAKFTIADITKTYGVQINAVDLLGNPIVVKKQLASFTSTGETDTLYFENAESANSVIDIGAIVSFGISETETMDVICLGKKENGDGTYELTLLPYDERVYEADTHVIGNFNPKVTPPKDSGLPIEYGDRVIPVTMNQVIQAIGIVKDPSEPEVPSNVSAVATETRIELKWDVEDSEFVKETIIEISRDGGANWTVVQSIDSNSWNYYFDRDVDSYPENIEGNAHYLGDYLFRLKNLSIYGIESDYCDEVEVDVTNYKTWIPPVPVIATTDADETGINITYNCSLSNVYGTNLFEVYVYYSGTLQRTLTTSENQIKYLFDRGTDGYPEKPNTQGLTLDTRTLDNYTVKVKAINVTSTNYSESQTANCTYSNYKTWIPNTPSISSRVVNRSVTLYLSTDNSCYGQVDYLVGVRSYKDTDGTFYVPDLETNPYSRESAYKLISEGAYVVGKLESDSVYSQTMPLETQNGTTGCLDVNESEEDNRILEIPLGSSNDRALQLGLGGFAPIDTQYQFEVYAFNRTVENYYDSLPNATGHNYDISTYHKVSISYARKFVIALATSVQDVLNGSIISDKIKEGAITETKIEDDAITAPKIQANAVVADKMYTYNMLCLHEGAHAISGYAYNAETDSDMKDLIWRIKNSKESSIKESLISQLDTFIKTHSNNFWIGLDTAHPEFYMGSDRISAKGNDNTSYFHYYYDDNTRSTNLDIKLTNFIVTAVSSTVKGFFNVRSKLVQYAGINAFLQVNPEFTANVGDYTAGYYWEGGFYDDERHTSYITPETGVVYKDIPSSKYYQWNGTAYYEVNATASESILVKGDVRIGNKNSSGNAGTLEVNGNTTLKSSLQVGTSDSSLTQNTKLYGTVGISGDTQINGDTTVGINQSGKKKNLTVNGNITNNGNTTVNGILGATALSQGILDMIYPVGSLYWTSKAPNAGGNPNTLFGGNWEQIKDTFIWAIGDTPANELPVGEITHTLTKSEMPSHDHGGVTDNPTTNPNVNVSGSFSTSQTASFYIRRNDDDNSLVARGSNTSVTQKVGDSWLTLDTDTQDSGKLDLVSIDVSLSNQSVSSSGTLPNHKHSIASQGGDQAHNNMPPYQMKYCWERRS